MNVVLHSDLEKAVEELQRNSSVNHGLVTEQDVEQKSKELRMLGETLTELKSECVCFSHFICLFSIRCVSLVAAAALSQCFYPSMEMPMLSLAAACRRGAVNC